MLDDVHVEFLIQNKVKMTAAQTFIQTFRLFADDEEVEEADEEQLLFQDVTDVSCGKSMCHTLKLVAISDTEVISASDAFKRISRATFGKCQPL